MKKRVLIALMLTTGLVLSMLLVTAVGANPTYVLLDSVDLGTTGSETGHNLVGWWPKVIDGTWIGYGWYGYLTSGGAPDYTSMDKAARAVWYCIDGVPEDPWAEVTLNTQGVTAQTVIIRHLDGITDDSFDLYVNDDFVSHYSDQGSTELWHNDPYDISGLGLVGDVTVKIKATAPPWLSGICSFGQVAIDWIKLEGPLPVTIDIKPGSDPNAINLGANGVIPVAIFGSLDLDVTEIDLSTVSLEGAQVRVKGKSDNYGSFDDLDEDGCMDVVIQVYNDMSGVLEGTATATLTGNLMDGTPIEGSDEIVVVPPK